MNALFVFLWLLLEKDIWQILNEWLRLKWGFRCHELIPSVLCEIVSENFSLKSMLEESYPIEIGWQRLPI
jgi:hypothetical protein